MSIKLAALLAILVMLRSAHAADEIKPKEMIDVYQAVTGSDADDLKQNWERVHKKRAYLEAREPSAFLRNQIDKIPVGRALDLAIGEGRNTIFLAKRGFRVDGVDISEVALHRARRNAKDQKVTINTIAADLGTYTVVPESYDLIVDIDFLIRSLIPKLKRGVKKGGYIIFENYTVSQLKNPGGENLKRIYLLELGELKQLFSDFKIIFYQETNDGKEARAQLVAQKI